MNAKLPSSVARSVAQITGEPVAYSSPVSGGCIHRAMKLTLESGRDIFLKYNHLEQGDNFRVEALGLQLLRGADCIPLPEVLAQGNTDPHAYLLLEWIEAGKAAPDYWEQFGRNLAQLHQHSDEQFGLGYDNYIGSLPQSNQQQRDWPSFFIRERLQPMVRRGQERGMIDAELRRQFEQLYPRIEDLFPTEPPALLHGDLWGGNIRVGPDGQAVILDPAVYYGHREMELAFMTLFDRQPKGFYQAYEAVYPLSAGWRERQDLCNLYPLLVHVNLFGSSYLSSTRQALRQYL